jgi:hypothetical protein
MVALFTVAPTSPATAAGGIHLLVAGKVGQKAVGSTIIFGAEGLTEAPQRFTTVSGDRYTPAGLTPNACLWLTQPNQYGEWDQLEPAISGWAWNSVPNLACWKSQISGGNNVTNYDANEEANSHLSPDPAKSRSPFLRVAGFSSLSFVLGAALTVGFFVTTSSPETSAEIIQNLSSEELEQSNASAEVDEGDSTNPKSVLESGTVSGFPEDKLDAAYELAAKMRGSVVQVFGHTDGGEYGGHGTGFLVEPDVIATNDHVINWIETEIYVRTIDGEVMTGELIGTDSYGDVAFVRLPAPIDAEIFQISRELVEVGEPVVAVGHPGMIGNWVTMAGVVTTVGAEYYSGPDSDLSRPYRNVVASTPSSPGASGSAVTRLDGVVVGIHAWALGTFSEDDWPPTDDGFPHTYIPRMDNSAGVSSASIIRLAGESGVELQLVD